MVIKRSLTSGCVTFWSLSEHTDVARLKAGWEALGLGAFVPEPRSPVACLKEALEETFGGSEVLIRSLAARNGFVVVKEQRGADDNAYETLFTAKVLDGKSEPMFTNFTEDTTAVLAAFRRHNGRLTNQQVGSALVKLMLHFGGARLRPTGGVYWLSGDRVEDWRAATDVLTAAADGGQSKSYFVEHELDADSIVAVRDALVTEVTNETRRIQQEIQSGELGGRALETRKNEAAALRQKVEAYEGILSVTLDSLKQGLDRIALSQGLAALMLSAIATPFDDATTPEPAHATVA